MSDTPLLPVSPAQMITAARLRLQVEHMPCPLCAAAGQWDDSGVVALPLVLETGALHRAAPYQYSNLYIAVVLTCRNCHYALFLTQGGFDQV